MGFISSGETSDVVIYFTPKAMEYLAGRKNSATDLSIKYFSMGDSDTNYLLSKKLSKGYIPDLSGENTNCLKNISIDIKTGELYSLWLSTDINERSELPPSVHKSPIIK